MLIQLSLAELQILKETENFFENLKSFAVRGFVSRPTDNLG